MKILFPRWPLTLLSSIDRGIPIFIGKLEDTT
jgi:hypothetical protein